MYSKQVVLDQDSMVEVTTRIDSGETKVLLSIRGRTSSGVVVTQALLEKVDVELLIESLKGASDHKVDLNVESL